MSGWLPAGGWGEVFAGPVTAWLVGGAATALALAAAVIAALSLRGTAGPALRRELWLRLGSWCVLLPLMVVPVLLGRVWTIGAVTVLGLLCLREYERATGLFREHAIAAVVRIGILFVNFAALDRWYGFFAALAPLTVATIAVSTIPLDRPAGYIQRTALGILGYALFGAGLAHLGYMANDPGYRPIVLMLLLAVALNDVLAFTVGKLLGGPKLLPHTSPNKTVSGALGALLPVAVLVAFTAHAVFRGTPLDRTWLLVALGLLVGVGAQAGDLLMSSVKRDLGIKDMGAVIPGHGGVLDRFNSLLLVAPSTFHLINYYVGFDPADPTRVLTGG